MILFHDTSAAEVLQFYWFRLGAAINNGMLSSNSATLQHILKAELSFSLGLRHMLSF